MLTSRLLAAAHMAPGTTRCELDSHADTCAFGKHCFVISTSSQKVSVSGFHPDLKSIANVRIATVAVAYDCIVTHTTYVLIFHQALFLPNMETNLLCPDQLREFGIVVNDVPLLRIRPHERTVYDHSIIDSSTRLHIPLRYNKPISYFNCRKPTKNEIDDNINHVHVQMTSELEWMPYDSMAEQDEQMIRESLREPTYAIAASKTLHNTTLVEESNLYNLLKNRVHATLSGVTTGDKRSIIQPDQLARRWRCSLETAKRTIERTTQRAVRDYTNIIGGIRLRPTHYQLKYPRLRCEVYTDTYFGPCKSLEGNTCCQVYAAKVQWGRAFPMRSKDDAHFTQDKLFRLIGFPLAIIPDNAKELTQGKFLRNAQKAQVPVLPLEPYMHNLSFAEDFIREALRLYNRVMVARNVPKVLWDRCFVYCCEIRSHMALGHHEQEGECGATIILGSTADISHIAEFGFYGWCWFWSPKESNQDRQQLGRWLGPSFDVGDVLCFAVMNCNGMIVHRSSVFPLSVEERNSEAIRELKKDYTTRLKERLGDRIKGITTTIEDDDRFQRPGQVRGDTPEYDNYMDDELEGNVFESPPVSEEENQLEFDRYISARVQMHQGDIPRSGVVKGRKRDANGNFIGHYHENPIWDTSMYEVEFEDGHVEAYHANEIAEAIYASVDDEGFVCHEIREILDHSRGARSLRADDGYIEIRGKRVPRRSTKGWKICVEWKDGSTSWVSLKDLKESNPIELAEYAVANKLVSEPAFSWWVPYTLKKRDRIIKAVRKRFHRKLEKFGIEIPRDVRRALEIDQ